MMSPEYSTDIKDTRQAVDNIEKYLGSEEDFRKVVNYIEPNTEIADRLFNTLSNSFKQKDINSFSDKYTNIYMRVYQDVYNGGRLINSGNNTPMGLNSFKEYFAQKTYVALEKLTKEKEDARLRESAERRRQSKIELETQKTNIINKIKSLSENQKAEFAREIIATLELNISSSDIMDVLSTEELSKIDSYNDFVLNIAALDMMNGAENEEKLNNLDEVAKILSEILQSTETPVLEEDIAINTEPDTKPNQTESLAAEPIETDQQIVEVGKAKEEVDEEDILTTKIKDTFEKNASKSTFDLSNEILKILSNKEYIQSIINLLDLSKSEKDEIFESITAIQKILKRDNTEFTEEDYSMYEINEAILQKILSSVADKFDIQYTPSPSKEPQAEVVEEVAAQGEQPLVAEEEPPQQSEQEKKLLELKSFYEGKIAEYDALHQDRSFADLANSKKFIRILEFSSAAQLEDLISLSIVGRESNLITELRSKVLNEEFKTRNLRELANSISMNAELMKEFVDKFVNNFYRLVLQTQIPEKSIHKVTRNTRKKIDLLNSNLDSVLKNRRLENLSNTRILSAEDEVPPAETTDGNSENITEMDDLLPIKKNLLPQVNDLMENTLTEQVIEGVFSIKNDEDFVKNIFSQIDLEMNNDIRRLSLSFYDNDDFDYSNFIRKHVGEYRDNSKKFLIAVFLLSVMHQYNHDNAISKQKLIELQNDILINTNNDSELESDSGKSVSDGEAPANSEPARESEIAFDEKSLEANLYKLFTELDQEYQNKILDKFNNDATAKNFTFEEIIRDPNNLEALTDTIRNILSERQDEIENYFDIVFSFVKLDTYSVEEMIDKIKKISDKNFRNLFSIRLLIGLKEIHSTENFDYSNVIKLLNEKIAEKSDEEEQLEVEAEAEDDNNPYVDFDLSNHKYEALANLIYDGVKVLLKKVREQSAKYGNKKSFLELWSKARERFRKKDTKENTLAISKVASLYNILDNLIDRMRIAKDNPDYQIQYLIGIDNGNRADSLAKIYRDIFENAAQDKSKFRNWVKKSLKLHIENNNIKKEYATKITNLINLSLFGGTWNKIFSTGRDIYEYTDSIIKPESQEDKVKKAMNLGSIFDIFQGAHGSDSDEAKEFIKIINDAAGEFITTYYNEYIDPYEFLKTLFARTFDPKEKKKIQNALATTFGSVLGRKNWNNELEEMKKSIDNDEIPAIIANKTYAKSLVVNIVREFIGRLD